MSIKTEYTCDRCGAVSNDERTMSTMHILMEKGPGKHHTCNHYSPKAVTKQADWCKSCVDKFHLTTDEKKDEEEKPATLEDLIREIVQQEVQEYRDD